MGGSLRRWFAFPFAGFAAAQNFQRVFGGEIICAHIGATTTCHAPLIGIRIAAFLLLLTFQVGRCPVGMPSWNLVASSSLMPLKKL